MLGKHFSSLCLLNVLPSYHPGGCTFDKHGACWTKPSVQKDEL